MKNIVGAKVREARKNHRPKLTQAQLASDLQLLGLDIDRAGVAKIETGLREVNDKELLIIAKALGVSVAWMMGEREQ